jgi:hypothetical protein
MPDLREDLEHIENGIRKLKIQYELFFVGAEKIPPNKLREEVDRLVRKYSNMSFQRAADRFYFNNVLSRYNAYAELWNKQLKQREEGRLPSGRPALRSVGPAAGQEAGPGRVPAPPASRAPAGAATDPAVRVSLDSVEESALQNLYNHLGAARARVGQGDALPAYEHFREQVRSQLQALRQKGVQGQVEFRVSVQDSKVSLKARPIR